MDLEQARQALTTELLIAIPADVPVQWDNRNTIDLSTEQRLHLRVEFIVHDSEQKSLGAVKVVRYLGVCALLVCAKEGAGTAESFALAQTLINALQMKNLSGLQMKTGKPERAACVDGWHLLPVSFPFWFDETVVQVD